MMIFVFVCDVLCCYVIAGLSGLITPSLDEMVYVAREMERRKMKVFFPFFLFAKCKKKTIFEL